MSRPLKFWVWDKEEQKMLYNPAVNPANGNGVNDIFQDDDFIWMQFTGLTDKHGHEIYEGDVLRFEDVGTVYPPDYTNVEVVWDEGTACFCVEFIEILDGNREEMWKYNENAVIIGNKYLHPELLEAT